MAARQALHDRTVELWEPPLDREDVVTIIGGLFDINANVLRILELLEDDGEEEAEADA